jgi:hypothetical protein
VNRAVFLWMWVGMLSGCAGAGVNAPFAKPVAKADELLLEVRCAPQEAEVRVDGVLEGTCELMEKTHKTIRSTAGSHELSVYAEGYRTYRSEVVGQGIHQSLTVHLQPYGDGE